MSYCMLIEFRDGFPAECLAFQNAWLGAAYIWDALYKTYLHDPRKMYDNWMSSCSGGDKRLWQLASREDLPRFERAVHAATFDYAIVEKEHFAMFAADLRQFAEKYGGTSHLLAWAEWVQKSAAERIGFMGTSVAGSLWCTWDESAGECREYDFATETKHWSVYEHIGGPAATAASA